MVILITTLTKMLTLFVNCTISKLSLECSLADENVGVGDVAHGKGVLFVDSSNSNRNVSI